MSDQLQLLRGTIEKSRTTFEEMAKIHNVVNFKSEASYAMQLLKANTFLQKIAMSNPQSLQYAVLNVASIGLSLNPIERHAYLVPRSGQICLDISYMGLIHILVESGAIKWMQAEIVRENDNFIFRGVGEKPNHECSPFSDRGEIVGVYCVAKTEDGEYLSTIMSKEECYAIRDRSEAWKRNQSGPWKTDEGEMLKKTAIKRAFKLLPKNDKAARIYDAIEHDNKQNHIDFAAEITPIEFEQKKAILTLTQKLGRSEGQLCEHLSRKFNRDVKKLDDIGKSEAESVIGELESFTPKKVEEKKPEPEFTTDNIPFEGE